MNPCGRSAVRRPWHHTTLRRWWRELVAEGGSDVQHGHASFRQARWLVGVQRLRACGMSWRAIRMGLARAQRCVDAQADVTWLEVESTGRLVVRLPSGAISETTGQRILAAPSATCEMADFYACVPGMQGGRGSRLLEQGRYEEAIRAYLRHAAVAGWSAALYYNVGNALCHAHRYFFAVRMFEAAVGCRPGMAIGWANLSRAHLLSGALFSAMTTGAQALVLDPSLRQARDTVRAALAEVPRPYRIDQSPLPFSAEQEQEGRRFRLVRAARAVVASTGGCRVPDSVCEEIRRGSDSPVLEPRG